MEVAVCDLISFKYKQRRYNGTVISTDMLGSFRVMTFIQGTSVELESCEITDVSVLGHCYQ